MFIEALGYLLPCLMYPQGICDGAGAVIIASEEAVKAHSLNPLARVVDYAVVGVDPTIMGIGPAPAIKQLLSKQGVSLNEIDLVEVAKCTSMSCVTYTHTYTCALTHSTCTCM